MIKNHPIPNTIDLHTMTENQCATYLEPNIFGNNTFKLCDFIDGSLTNTDVGEIIMNDDPVADDPVADITIITNPANNYTAISESSNNNYINLDIETGCNCVEKAITDLSFDFTKLKIEDVSECKIINEISDNASKSKKFIIAIDNDECIGSWGDLSILYSMLKMELGKEPDVEMFKDIMLRTGCVRPYVKNFFEKLLELKKNGIVYKIFMFTAASNSVGWVVYLSKILENWIGQKIYDKIIYKEMIEEWHIFNKSPVSNNLGYIKNMNMIRELINFHDKLDHNNFHIVAIDDRPANIINGIAIGVSPFRVAINLFEVLRLFVPDKFEYLVSKYDSIINGAWENYMRNPSIFTNTNLDFDIIKSMEHIDKIIYYNS
jgi:hypothetical protein